VAPDVSVVVPALNEEACIASFIDAMSAELSQSGTGWEIVVVDDGSTDQTGAIVTARAQADARVRLVEAPHRGKGAAVRLGMQQARGRWRFMADADLSMPPDNLRRFLALTQTSPAPDILIGSRELPGARRFGEPWQRHVIGRMFNWVVRALAVPGLRDTQCGYKLLSAAAVERLFPHLTIDGFAFDVEMLVFARQAGLDVREVAIDWHCRSQSRVAIRRGASAFLDVVRIRWRAAGLRPCPTNEPQP
jgi:dolichyl-phosphate beta-glucosyltransferase